MAHTKSAKKRIRQNEKRRLRNRRRKAHVKAGVRAFEDALAANQPDEAAERLREVYKRLDRIASDGTIHKNTAARKKAQLAKRLNALSA